MSIGSSRGSNEVQKYEDSVQATGVVMRREEGKDNEDSIREAILLWLNTRGQA